MRSSTVQAAAPFEEPCCVPHVRVDCVSGAPLSAMAPASTPLPLTRCFREPGCALEVFAGVAVASVWLGVFSGLCFSFRKAEAACARGNLSCSANQCRTASQNRGRLSCVERIRNLCAARISLSSLCLESSDLALEFLGNFFEQSPLVIQSLSSCHARPLNPRLLRICNDLHGPSQLRMWLS